MNDTVPTLIFGGILSTIISAVGTAETPDYGIFEIVKTVSASGVLAITFWWITQRLEKRLDDAFTSYKELNRELLDILKERENDDD